MTAPQLLERARKIDADIQAVDRRLFWARFNAAPEHSIYKLLAQRNTLTRSWGETWSTRRVAP